MKRIAAILTVLLVAVAVTGAQPVKSDPNKIPQYFYQPLTTSGSYANSQSDTSLSYRVGGATRVSYSMTVNDSASLKVYLDYRLTSSGSWTIKDSTTVTNATTGAATSEWVLRDATTEKLSGVIPYVRFRRAFQGSANGVTTPTYSDQINWKP